MVSKFYSAFSKRLEHASPYSAALAGVDDGDGNLGLVIVHAAEVGHANGLWTVRSGDLGDHGAVIGAVEVQ